MASICVHLVLKVPETVVTIRAYLRAQKARTRERIKLKDSLKENFNTGIDTDVDIDTDWYYVVVSCIRS